MTNFSPLTIEERFLRKIEPDPNSGCWLWTAAVDGKGYGTFHIGRRQVGAHRFAWGASERSYSAHGWLSRRLYLSSLRHTALREILIIFFLRAECG